jgi:hypothetical protein
VITPAKPVEAAGPMIIMVAMLGTGPGLMDKMILFHDAAAVLHCVSCPALRLPRSRRGFYLGSCPGSPVKLVQNFESWYWPKKSLKTQAPCELAPWSWSRFTGDAG